MLLCHEYNTIIYGTFACLLSSLAVGQVAVAVYKLAPFVREFLFAFDKRGMQQQHCFSLCYAWATHRQCISS